MFYRSTSDIIERLDLAKILMLLDNGKIGSYRGQSVADIAMEGEKKLNKIHSGLF